jgi:hypothetical protein
MRPAPRLRASGWTPTRWTYPSGGVVGVRNPKRNPSTFPPSSTTRFISPRSWKKSGWARLRERPPDQSSMTVTM